MPVHIGSKFTGRPAAHADTTTGVYWESLPKIEGSSLTIQQSLLAKPKEPRKPLLQRLKPRVSLPGLVGMPK